MATFAPGADGSPWFERVVIAGLPQSDCYDFMTKVAAFVRDAQGAILRQKMRTLVVIGCCRQVTFFGKASLTVIARHHVAVS